MRDSTAERHFFILMNDLFVCSKCNVQKSIQEDAVWNANSGCGFINLCRDCARRISREKRNSSTREYARIKSREHYAKDKGNVQKKWYVRAKADLTDGYIKIILRAEFRSKGIKLLAKDIPAELIIAKRLSLQLKSNLKELPNA